MKNKENLVATDHSIPKIFKKKKSISFQHASFDSLLAL